MQRQSLDYIADQYVKFGGPPADVTPRNCLTDLCSTCPLYTLGRGDMVSYSKDLVSWPSGGSAPVALDSALLEADRLWLQDWKAHMLRPPAEAAALRHDLGLRQPYIDPELRHPATYGKFIAELRERGMLRLSPAEGRRGLLGVFVVAKKSGQQRLVFDTRVSNTRFKPPPRTELPSGGAFARMETQGSGDTWFSSGDLSNAFYAMQVPEGLCEYFSLLPARAGLAGVAHLDGVPVHESDWLLPELTILPMGWSWALHLCQCVSEAALARAYGA